MTQSVKSFDLIFWVMYIIRKFSDICEMDCSDMKIISVILGIDYEVKNERMRYVKLWKESKNFLLLLTSDKLMPACGTIGL